MPRLTSTQLEARRLASEFTPEALEILKGIARSGPITAKLEACEQLLDRSLGKPESRLEVEQHKDQDEIEARAFADLVVQMHPELAEMVFRRALPAGQEPTP